MIGPSFNQLVSDNPKQLWLQLFPAELEKAKQQSRDCSNEVARWNAYLNSLCVNALFKEFQEDLEEGIRVWPSRQALGEIWEVVNGSAIKVGDTRLVLIPSDSKDIERFSVPQEWVDVPRWAGHYYLAVQMHLEEDECWLRVWGFTTHQRLKQGEYNPSEGTYSVARQDLVESLNVLWVARDVCAEPQPAVAELQPLGKQRAEQLLARLGKPTPYSPRLEADFRTAWAPLMVNPEYRQELLVRRSQKWLPLGEWAEKIRDEAAEAIKAAGWLLAEEVFGPKQLEYGLRYLPGTETEAETRVLRHVKTLELKTGRAVYPVALVINWTKNVEKETGWVLPQVFALDASKKSPKNACLPEGLQLIVLDERGEAFDRAEAGAGSTVLQLDDWFGDSPVTKFSVRLVLGEVQLVEQFWI